MTNEEFIIAHRADDVRTLALKRMPEGIDAQWCLQQIEGWQLAQSKLPLWAATEGLWFPPRLSMEQCSSEATALYKRTQIERLLPDEELRQSMVDLTGGYGVDFSFIAPVFQRAVYAERMPHLCDIARHNLSLLELQGAEVVCEEIGAGSTVLSKDYSLIYLDPARRDTAGRKTVAIEDCTPDVAQLMPTLLQRAEVVMVKLSPMLDITQALRALPMASEVHVVSVKGECKELLIVCRASAPQNITYYCANLGSDGATFVCTAHEAASAPLYCASEPQNFLYEPNASILKGNVQNIAAHRYGLQKLHPMSNLFTSSEPVTSFPGRAFRVTDWSDFNKRNLKQLLAGLTQANLAIRNFPATVAELRKRLKLREGGAVYLFATTLADGTHALLRCEKQA